MYRYLIVLFIMTLAIFASGETRTLEVVRADFDYPRAIITGTVEGITEFLPISSTGHMIISDRLLGVPNEREIFVDDVQDRNGRSISLERVADDYIVIIQIGAILAVLLAFYHRIKELIQGIIQGSRSSLQLAFAILIAFLPLAIIGYCLKDFITTYLFSVQIVAIALIVGGIVIIVSERKFPAKEISHNDELSTITWRAAFTVGLCQCFAVIPGTSRSLATILGGRITGLSHRAATEFSFLVGLLTLSAASLYKMWSMGPALIKVYPAGPASVGLLVAAITAFITVKWLVNYVSKRGLGVFAWYRIALGGAILVFFNFK